MSNKLANSKSPAKSIVEAKITTRTKRQLQTNQEIDSYLKATKKAKPKVVNEKLYKLLENYVNNYTSYINANASSNGALFQIFETFFQNLRARTPVAKRCGVELDSIIIQNLPQITFYIPNDSFNKEGISFSFIFDEEKYFVRFMKYRDGDNMYYDITIKSENEVSYSFEFIYKYLLYNALEISNLKGSYINMPRDSFSWDIRTLEERTFDDIYLPTEITEDLKMYVKIYDKSGRILRYLKVGNPGVGKTESTIVLASELKKRGVTIIKTPICKLLHDKVELANVLSPALIICDDIDLSLGDRNKGAYSQLLGDFLDVLDGTDKLAKDVGIIATTNAAHLLDLAAQRPGRFDKTLLFDNITKDNIRRIILKSLRSNFKVTSGKEPILYTDPKIVTAFYDAGVTGSHVYNTIKMLKLKYDTLNEIVVSVPKIIEGINAELEVIKKVRKISYLKEKLERNTGSVGFGRTSEGGEEEDMSEEGCISDDVKTGGLYHR